MAGNQILIRLGLVGQPAVARGLAQTASGARAVGAAAESAGANVRRLVGTIGVAAGAGGIGALAAAGVKWGLSFNSQVEQARLRFQLFTSDVDGLTKSVQAIDKASMFNFADLADAAALLGGSGIKDVPKTLQAAANAAAGGGKGTEGLKSIVLALSQIASKGRLSQEEVNQLTEGGAITAQRDLSKGLGLTAKQLQNLGGQGIEASKALDVLTKAWTSGKMADAAQRQLGTLQGQWGLFTGDMQKLSGLATQGLTMALEKNVIPAANRATEQITKIFGDKGISNKEKLRRARAVIKRELGPVADDIKIEIDKADIPGHLGDLVGAALPKMAAAAADAAPHVADAFVRAWLHSGPWAQLATLLFAAKKLGDVRGGISGGRGGLGGLLGKAAPTPVFVTNWPGAMPSGVPGGGAGGSLPSGSGSGPWVYDKYGNRYPNPHYSPPSTRKARLGRAAGGALAAVPFAIEAFQAGEALGQGVDLHDPAYKVTHALLKPFGPLIPGNRPQAEDPISRSLRTGEIITTPQASEIGRQIAAGARFTFTLDGQPLPASVARSNAKKKARK